MSNKGKITLVNSEGKEVEFDVLFTFDAEDTNKSYIVYTDNSIDEKGNIRVFASTYNKDDERPELKEIETQQEWDVISDILTKLETKVRNGEITADDQNGEE